VCDEDDASEPPPSPPTTTTRPTAPHDHAAPDASSASVCHRPHETFATSQTSDEEEAPPDANPPGGSTRVGASAASQWRPPRGVPPPRGRLRRVSRRRRVSTRSLLPRGWLIPELPPLGVAPGPQLTPPARPAHDRRGVIRAARHARDAKPRERTRHPPGLGEARARPKPQSPERALAPREQTPGRVQRRRVVPAARHRDERRRRRRRGVAMTPRTSREDVSRGRRRRPREDVAFTRARHARRPRGILRRRLRRNTHARRRPRDPRPREPPRRFTLVGNHRPAPAPGVSPRDDPPVRAHRERHPAPARHRPEPAPEAPDPRGLAARNRREVGGAQPTPARVPPRVHVPPAAPAAAGARNADGAAVPERHRRDVHAVQAGNERGGEASDERRDAGGLDLEEGVQRSAFARSASRVVFRVAAFAFVRRRLGSRELLARRHRRVQKAPDVDVPGLGDRPRVVLLGERFLVLAELVHRLGDQEGGLRGERRRFRRRVPRSVAREQKAARPRRRLGRGLAHEVERPRGFALREVGLVLVVQHAQAQLGRVVPVLARGFPEEVGPGAAERDVADPRAPQALFRRALGDPHELELILRELEVRDVRLGVAAVLEKRRAAAERGAGLGAREGGGGGG
jgi:hypothetical protein